MDEIVALLLAGVLVVQVPISILVYFDAKRRGLKNPTAYHLGVLVPAAGFVVVPVYLSRRDDLPREESDSA
ncbi:hypothetical protein AB7C87_09190 [Natrarchaeobius sp. A-rgal3]|uniref:hypothetical protein n=1 Tax=Natrarchaeobius versutus TaxID=1679078 RepID=UPI00350F49A4